MILVTGCGRSGTHYVARVMQAMGLDVGHEAIGKDGCVSWKHIVSGDFVVNKKRVSRTTAINSEGFSTIIHQVRDPLKVISSMQTFGDATLDFMAKSIELDRSAPLIYQAMQGYLGWNLLVEKKAVWRFKIEDFEQIFAEFCSKVGLPGQPLPSLDKKARDSRKKRYRELKWQDLNGYSPDLTEKIMKMATDYGYDSEI